MYLCTYVIWTIYVKNSCIYIYRSYFSTLSYLNVYQYGSYVAIDWSSFRVREFQSSASRRMALCFRWPDQPWPPVWSCPASMTCETQHFWWGLRYTRRRVPVLFFALSCAVSVAFQPPHIFIVFQCWLPVIPGGKFSRSAEWFEVSPLLCSDKLGIAFPFFSV